MMKPEIMKKIRIQIIDENGEARVDETFDNYEIAIDELQTYCDLDYMGDL